MNNLNRKYEWIMNTTLKLSAQAMLMLLLMCTLSNAMQEIESTPKDSIKNYIPSLAELAYRKISFNSLSEEKLANLKHMLSSSNHLQHICNKTKAIQNLKNIYDLKSNPDNEQYQACASLFWWLSQTGNMNKDLLEKSMTENESNSVIFNYWDDLRENFCTRIHGYEWKDLYRTCAKVGTVTLNPEKLQMFSKKREAILSNINQLQYLPVLSTLTLNGIGLRTLKKIKNCKHLSILDVRDNPIEDFSALADFKNVTELYISGNNMAKAIPKELTKMEKLKHLVIDKRLIKNADQEELKKRGTLIIATSGMKYTVL